MTLQSSGTISLSNIDVEIGRSSTATINLNESTVRTLAGVSSGAISLSNFYGKNYRSTQTFSIEFLLVAGGGGGGGKYGSGSFITASGGGGGGGIQTSTQSINGNRVITITVGDGGAAGTTVSPANPTRGGTGSNSSISGTGVTTVTANGGGGGGAIPRKARPPLLRARAPPERVGRAGVAEPD